MKKIFISQPMKGLSVDVIVRTRNHMKDVASAILNEDVEVIDSYIPGEFKDKDVVTSGVAYLGESIRKMCSADYFVGLEGQYDKVCSIERRVAFDYKIPIIMIPVQYICPECMGSFNDANESVTPY